MLCCCGTEVMRSDASTLDISTSGHSDRSAAIDLEYACSSGR